MEYYVGLDIGGTNGRLKVTATDGTVLGEFQASGCSINTDGYEKSRARYRELVLPSLRKLSLKPSECRGICGAISGVDSDSIEASCRAIFEEMGFSQKHLTIVNDCEVFLHLSEGPALVLISGTGSICYGRDSKNQIYRTGGWNHMISDEGSGFDLGLQFLLAVANDLDGRKKATILTPMVIKESGLDTLEKINDFINQNLFEKSQIAKFAELGYEAAKKGDVEAQKVHKACADKLYLLVKDTMSKLEDSMQIEMDLWIWGSVLIKNELIQGYLSQAITEKLQMLKLRIPHRSAIDTAVMIAMNHAR